MSDYTGRMPRWVLPVCLVLGLGFCGFFAWGTWSIHQRSVSQLAELKAANERSNVIITELRKLTKPAVWVDEKQVINNCTTNRDTVTCTFTNKENFPITTCVKGLLYQKDATGVRLHGLPMCTGTLMPAETKVVSGTWVAGFADDICNRDGYGGKVLDWSKCVFTTETHDLSAALTP